MSSVEMHAPFTHFRGTIGKLVYRKVKGKTVVALKPDADRPLSQAETAHRKSFTEAAEWATAALKNDEFRQTYEELGRERDIPTRAAAVSDYLVSPSIEQPASAEPRAGLDPVRITGGCGRLFRRQASGYQHDTPEEAVRRRLQPSDRCRRTTRCANPCRSRV